MPAFAIIKELNVIKKAGSGFRSCFIILKTNPLGFQRMKETFHRSIIPAVTFPAHTADGTQIA
jgi:hypothetical protein